MALALQTSVMLEIGVRAFYLLDGAGLLRTLVDGYVAHTAATAMSRLWAVIAISSLTETLGPVTEAHLDEASPLQQVCQTCIAPG